MQVDEQSQDYLKVSQGHIQRSRSNLSILFKYPTFCVQCWKNILYITFRILQPVDLNITLYYMAIIQLIEFLSKNNKEISSP